MQRLGGWRRSACILPLGSTRQTFCLSSRAFSMSMPRFVEDTSALIDGSASSSTSAPTPSTPASSVDAPLVMPLLSTSPSPVPDQEGKRFGRINAIFHNGASAGFNIHGGLLHESRNVRPNFNPLAEPRPLFLKDASVFASMVDVPVRLPWSPTAGSIEMWDSARMKGLGEGKEEAYQMDSVKRKRARKMNKHKHRKKLKETRFLRRKLKQA